MSKRQRCTFNDYLEKEFKFIKLDKWTAEKLLQEVESVPCSLVGSGEFSQLKNFCDFAGNNYAKLLEHGNTRFLSLGPSIDRILSMFDGLRS